jgi:UDP-N-acetylmuramoyl-L-alanyl-D-glutamate--2,6-diaminopimelate ligase
LKLEIFNQPYRYITENSSMCDTQCAFLVTKQNEKYQEDALQRGAKVLLTPQECWKLLELDRIKVIGITGTNGKTTTASTIYSMLLDLEYKCAMQGTRGFFMNDKAVEGKTLTTPTVLNTYAHMLDAINANC